VFRNMFIVYPNIIYLPPCVKRLPGFVDWQNVTTNKKGNIVRTKSKIASKNTVSKKLPKMANAKKGGKSGGGKKC